MSCSGVSLGGRGPSEVVGGSEQREKQDQTLISVVPLLLWTWWSLFGIPLSLTQYVNIRWSGNRVLPFVGLNCYRPNLAAVLEGPWKVSSLETCWCLPGWPDLTGGLLIKYVAGSWRTLPGNVSLTQISSEALISTGSHSHMGLQDSSSSEILGDLYPPHLLPKSCHCPVIDSMSGMVCHLGGRALPPLICLVSNEPG